MAFDPLGHFNPNAPVNPAIVAAAKVLWASLPEVPVNDLTRVYLHWSVQSCSSLDTNYSVVVGQSGGHYKMTVTNDPRHNARSTFDNANYAEHTYHRNTGAVGIALNGMDGSNVSPHNFGADPVTVSGLTWLCAAAAAVCKRYDIHPCGLSLDSDSYYGEFSMLTHAEAANSGGIPQAYAPYGIPPVGTFERWDLSTFCPLPADVELTDEMAATCGNALRKLTHSYKVALG